MDLGGTKVLELPHLKQKVLARQPSLVTLIASGGFPSELAAVVWKMYERGDNGEQMTSTPDGIRQMANLIEAYVPHVLVKPQVGAVTHVTVDGDGVLDGTIAMIDLPDLDKRYLFFYGQRLLAPIEQTVSAPVERADLPDPGPPADVIPEPARA
jgi:hypothetical protein